MDSYQDKSVTRSVLSKRGASKEAGFSNEKRESGLEGEGGHYEKSSVRERGQISKKRAVLGRGLKSLFSTPTGAGGVPSKDGQTTGMEVLQKTSPSYLQHIDVEKIEPGAHQPRQLFNREALEELGVSLRENGFIQPIVVRKPDKNLSMYEIIAGERRWRAAGLAGIHKVPCIVMEKGDQDSAILALIENIQRQDLNPIERAEAFRRLMESQNLTQEQLALKIGIPRASLANYLRLLHLHKDVKEMIIKKELSYGLAKLLGTEKDLQKQQAVAREIVSRKMGIREAQIYIKTEQKRAGEKHTHLEASSYRPQSDVLEKEVCEKVERLTELSTAIKWKNRGGQLILRFYSDDQLQGFIDLLSK